MLSQVIWFPTVYGWITFHCIMYNIYTFKELIFSHLYFYWTNIKKINCNFISFTCQQIFNHLSFKCRIKCIWKKKFVYTQIYVYIYMYILKLIFHVILWSMFHFYFFVLFYPFFFLIASFSFCLRYPVLKFVLFQCSTLINGCTQIK